MGLSTRQMSGRPCASFSTYPSGIQQYTTSPTAYHSPTTHLRTTIHVYSWVRRTFVLSSLWHLGSLGLTLRLTPIDLSCLLFLVFCRNVRPGREADEKPRRDVRHGFFYVRKPRRVRRRARRHHGNVHGRRRRRDDDGTCSRLRSFPSHLITSHLRLVFLVTSDFWIVSRDAYQSSSSNTDKTISLSSRILLLPLLLLLYRIRWT